MKLSPFVRDLLERAIKSFFQGAVAAVGLQAVVALADNPLDLSAWQAIGLSALGGGLTALFSFVTSLLSKAKTGTASASTVVAQTAVPEAHPVIPTFDSPSAFAAAYPGNTSSVPTLVRIASGPPITRKASTPAKHDGDEPDAISVEDAADKARYSTP